MEVEGKDRGGVGKWRGSNAAGGSGEHPPNFTVMEMTVCECRQWHGIPSLTY